MDSLATAGREAFTLGAARVEPGRNVLFAGERVIRLEPKVMDVLVALAEAAGDVVPRETLIERIWNVEYGGDESVSRAISLLRKALKEADLGDKAIETVTKRGYRLTVAPSPAVANSSPVPEVAASAQRRPLLTINRWPLVAAAALSLAAIVAAFAWRDDRPAGRPTELNVVAVLPFDDLSPKGDQAWFADGLADELIDSLSSAPGLTVIGRSSSFQVRGPGVDARVIGERLGARYLVEGGVRRDGDLLRISASLVDTGDGATKWTQTYERNAGDIFAVQEDIATQIAAALNVHLSFKDALAHGIGTRNMQAFEAFLLGKAFYVAEGAENMERAVTMFRRATELDPNYVDAWLGLVSALSVYDFWRPEQLKAASAERARALQRALEIDPDAPGPNSYRAWREAENGNFEEADRIFARLDRGAKRACDAGSFMRLILYGRLKEDDPKCLEIGVASDPLSIGTSETAQFIAHLTGRTDIEVREYERSKTIPGGPQLGEIYAFLRAFNAGDRAAAKAHFRKMVDFLPARIDQFEAVYDNFDDDARVREILNEALVDPANQDPTRTVMIAKLLAIYGDPDGAAEALRRHFLVVGGTWWQELWMPEHAETRKRDAFKEIVRAKGLERYFRATGKWNDFCRPTSPSDFECV
ncbi:MAG: winged helix-turn-helix domain-containing protein [Pseudomonadota bacterium]